MYYLCLRDFGIQYKDSKLHTSNSTLQCSALIVWCTYLNRVVPSQITHCCFVSVKLVFWGFFVFNYLFFLYFHFFKGGIANRQWATIIKKNGPHI